MKRIPVFPLIILLVLIIALVSAACGGGGGGGADPTPTTGPEAVMLSTPEVPTPAETEVAEPPWVSLTPGPSPAPQRVPEAVTPVITSTLTATPVTPQPNGEGN